MVYKDKDKQREANREAQVRFKAKQSLVERGITEKVLPLEPKSVSVIPKPDRTVQGNIRVSKPGDADYVPQCETTKAFIEDRPKRMETAKRGKDIKCFVDLPLDVQLIINEMSLVDGKIDKTIKANRTAIAVNYQHIYPNRYHSTMAAVVVAGRA